MGKTSQNYQGGYTYKKRRSSKSNYNRVKTSKTRKTSKGKTHSDAGGVGASVMAKHNEDKKLIDELLHRELERRRKQRIRQNQLAKQHREKWEKRNAARKTKKASPAKKSGSAKKASPAKKSGSAKKASPAKKSGSAKKASSRGSLERQKSGKM